MSYTKQEFLNALGVRSLHESFFEDYEVSLAEFDSKGAFFLADSFVEALQAEWGFLRDKYDFVMQELARVRANDLAARYAYLLYKMLLRNAGSPRITLEETPSFSDTQTRVDFEMAAYFSLLAFAPDMITAHKKRGLPTKVIADTLCDCFEDTIRLRNVTDGRDGFDDKVYFSWFQLYTNLSIVRIGILNFEVNKTFGNAVKVFKNKAGEYKMLSAAQEISNGGYIAGSAGYPDTAFVSEYCESDNAYIGYPVDMENACVRSEKITLPKSEWRLALDEGDGVFSIHIPSGAPITPENCVAQYREAFKIAQKYYPEYSVKALYCHSWLLDPALKDLAKKGSNIVSFGSRFLRYPTVSEGRGVFMFLFRKYVDNLEELPENTSLERAVKAHYLEGKYVYEVGGVIFEDML